MLLFQRWLIFFLIGPLLGMTMITPITGALPWRFLIPGGLFASLAVLIYHYGAANRAWPVWIKGASCGFAAIAWVSVPGFILGGSAEVLLALLLGVAAMPAGVLSVWLCEKLIPPTTTNK